MMRSKPKIVTDKLKDKLKDKIIRDIWTLFETEQEDQGRRELEKKKEPNERLIKDRIIKGTRTLLNKKKIYHEPKRVSNFWNNCCIEYESNGDKNSNLSLDKYLDKIKLYLKNIIINLQNSHTVNPKNEDDRCFQYVATVALNYKSIDWNTERAQNTKLFTNKHSWEGINYTWKKDD